ncbi:MAG: hypothetical protein IT536_03100 [Hyphomicrobiales bacterium]|nr:hypothetical protein [Hyphomicrobiales bacterium]
MAVDGSPDKKIVNLQCRLAELDRERAIVLSALEQLKQRRMIEAQATPTSQIVSGASPTVLSNAQKVALFHSLFRGRDDVFPRRWENAKTSKAGYAPACHNEWVRGICEKPRIKCSNCPNQAFVSVAEDVVRSHPQGRDVANPGKAEPFIAGVYPLMTDETCWFWPPTLTSSHGSVMRWRS